MNRWIASPWTGSLGRGNLLLGPVTQTGRNGSGCPGGGGLGRLPAEPSHRSHSLPSGKSNRGHQRRGSRPHSTRVTPRCVLYTQGRGRMREDVIFPDAWHFHWASTSPWLPPEPIPTQPLWLRGASPDPPACACFWVPGIYGNRAPVPPFNSSSLSPNFSIQDKSTGSGREGSPGQKPAEPQNLKGWVCPDTHPSSSHSKTPSESGGPMGEGPSQFTVQAKTGHTHQWPQTPSPTTPSPTEPPFTRPRGSDFI